MSTSRFGVHADKDEPLRVGVRHLRCGPWSGIDGPEGPSYKLDRSVGRPFHSRPSGTAMQAGLGLKWRCPASALVHLDFRVKGFEFAASIVEFHLPVDGALLFANVARPGRSFVLKLGDIGKSSFGNALTG